MPELPPRIGADEFGDRQRRARAAARERGYAALVAWSRGGTTQDRYQEVLWLAGYYPQFPTVPDRPGAWMARGHAALLLPVDGEAVLIQDLPAFREDLAAADRIVATDDPVAALAVAVAESVPGDGVIGVLGVEALSARWHGELVRRCGDRFAWADELGPALRLVKSPAEQALLRAAGQIGVRAVEAIMSAAEPGAWEGELVAAGVGELLRGGAMLYGISLSCGEWAHTYAQSQPAPFDPRNRLRHGDMLRLDLYGSVDGYLFDFGRSTVVGREPDGGQKALLDVVRAATEAGLRTIRPGVPIGDVARSCAAAYDASEFARRGLGLRSGFDVWGHSLGLGWEPPYVEEGGETVLTPGVCIAIEKRVAAPGIGGASFEQNVLVTPSGYELLSPARTDWSPRSASSDSSASTQAV
jgi:Xaa-Pro aminopeptidase